MKSMNEIATSQGRLCRRKLLVVPLVVGIVMASRAEAYIDPGSGALLWQALLATLFGLMFYLRSIVRHVKRWFGREKEEPAERHE